MQIKRFVVLGAGLFVIQVLVHGALSLALHFVRFIPGEIGRNRANIASIILSFIVFALVLKRDLYAVRYPGSWFQKFCLGTISYFLCIIIIVVSIYVFFRSRQLL